MDVSWGYNCPGPRQNTSLLGSDSREDLGGVALLETGHWGAGPAGLFSSFCHAQPRKYLKGIFLPIKEGKKVLTKERDFEMYLFKGYVCKILSSQPSFR